MGRHLLNAGTVSPQIKWREQQRLMVVTAIQVCKSFLCVCVFTGGGGIIHVWEGHVCGCGLHVETRGSGYLFVCVCVLGG